MLGTGTNITHSMQYDLFKHQEILSLFNRNHYETGRKCKYLGELRPGTIYTGAFSSIYTIIRLIILINQLIMKALTFIFISTQFM
jgi:hemoglobin-like flavoprotein